MGYARSAGNKQQSGERIERARFVGERALDKHAELLRRLVRLLGVQGASPGTLGGRGEEPVGKAMPPRDDEVDGGARFGHDEVLVGQRCGRVELDPGRVGLGVDDGQSRRLGQRQYLHVFDRGGRGGPSDRERVRLRPREPRHVEIGVLSGLVLPALVHRDGHPDGVLARRHHPDLGRVGAPQPAKGDVSPEDGEETVEALKPPDGDGNVDVELVGQLVDIAVQPRAEKEDSHTYLVRCQEDLVVRVSDGSQGGNQDEEERAFGLRQKVRQEQQRRLNAVALP